ncbi:hypothetical protein RRG08_007507 [Elysia crispata]|uniref:Uncharacterized protein n=1 Tax=Elysia crispata TaxID=231223 RepID=A0AAE1DEX7_9GAST|nr:hypothetical protein RRG08_007507 [Elysia crispata]
MKPTWLRVCEEPECDIPGYRPELTSTAAGVVGEQESHRSVTAVCCRLIRRGSGMFPPPFTSACSVLLNHSRLLGGRDVACPIGLSSVKQL